VLSSPTRVHFRTSDTHGFVLNRSSFCFPCTSNIWAVRHIFQSWRCWQKFPPKRPNESIQQLALYLRRRYSSYLTKLESPTWQHGFRQPIILIPHFLQYHIQYFFVKQKWRSSYLYRCTVHSVVYLINTPTNAHIFI